MSISCSTEINSLIMFDESDSLAKELQKVINGKPFRTIITDSSDILGVFKNNISPPVFE